jgi:hypothetical protein
LILIYLKIGLNEGGSGRMMRSGIHSRILILFGRLVEINPLSYGQVELGVKGKNSSLLLFSSHAESGMRWEV